MKETNISKRIISFLLVLSMIFGTMTTLAFADGDWTADTFNFDDPSVLIAGTNENKYAIYGNCSFEINGFWI